MDTTRRDFAKLLGASLVAPLAPPAGRLSLWERADLEEQQTGQVSAELTRALLDVQGTHGIFGEPEHFEALRAALARKLRDHRLLRAFEVPADVEPLLNFEA